jgi:hypothetical protein
MREAIPQMTQIGDIDSALDTIKGRLDELEHSGALNRNELNVQNSTHASNPYYIGQSDRAEDAVNVHLWVHSNYHNRTVKVCLHTFTYVQTH